LQENILFFFYRKSDLVTPKQFAERRIYCSIVTWKKESYKFEMASFFSKTMAKIFYFCSEQGSFVPFILKMLIHRRIHVVPINTFAVKMNS